MAILDWDGDHDDPRHAHEPDKQGQSSVPKVPEEKPYHAKRPHRKSRLGCRNCKARKVKCDEAKPSCRNCTLRKETCVYPSLSRHPPQLAGSASASTPTSSLAAAAAFPPVSASASSLPLSGPSRVGTSAVPNSASSVSSLSSRTFFPRDVSSSTSVLAQQLSPAPTRRGSDDDAPYGSSGTGVTIVDEPTIRLADADDFDMKLLWFYTNQTYASVSIEAGRIPYVDHILKSHIIRFAFQSPFLMDCILGLSAMHMQSMNLPVPMPKALIYRARAFSGYRKAIESAQSKDYPALLVCSLLLCALSSALFREPDMKPLYVVDWMVVWHGIGLIFKVVPTEALFASGLDKLFSRPAFNLNETALHVPNNLLFMATSIKEGDEDYPFIDAYYGTLKFLGGLYLELENGFSPVLSLRIITFYTFLPSSFIELGRMHRPKALVILAHHMTFLKLVENVWWLVGIADRAIQDIIDHVGPEWQPLLDVPRAAIGMSDRVELAKLIKGNHAWQPGEVDQIVHHPNPESRKLTMVNNVGEEVAYDKQRGWVPLARTEEPGDNSACPWGYLSPPRGYLSPPDS